ncbi:hypothetical protein CCMA1212_008371 [Trichoderma ghanense]|uniref:CHAT domain-containing protein n=1 Tax=Trichoderma ghanense TaxID=65468 RepID=A0ABY2GXM4_9HYPO
MDEVNDDHFRTCSRLLTLAIRSMPEGFSALMARSEEDEGKEHIEITEALTDDDTRIIAVKSRSSSWDVSPTELLSDRLKEQLPWYLEDYAQLDPLDTSRAKSVAEELGGYGRRLFNALEFERLRDKLNESTSLLTISVHHSTHTSAFPETLWEALEEPSLWSAQGIHAQVIVRRVFQGEPRIRVRVRKTFNILYVVARPMTPESTNSIDPNAYIDHRLLSKAVVQTISAMQDDSVQVELQMVRPGTFKAFKDHLTRVRDAIGRPGYFDLVHLDMHGRVESDEEGERYQLGFLDGDTLGTQWIDAPHIAQLLEWHGIPAALLNACESANTRQRGDTNLAQALVQHGVAFVVAMSFKLSTSAAQIFIQAFYRKLLAGYPNYNTAVLAGRNALRSEPTRDARLGLRLPVQDWAVPVLYIDTANTVLTANYTGNQLMTMYTLEGQLYSPFDTIAPERARAMQRAADSPTPYHVPDLDTVMGVLDPAFIGRDFEILWIETLLCRANILRIYGLPSVGKTCLAKHLGAWWTRTYFSYFVRILHCSSPDYLSRLDELVAGRSTIFGVEMLTAPQPTDPSYVPKPPRMVIFDGLDELDASSVNNNGDLRFNRTCEALPSLMASGAKLVFISRKPRLGLESSQPDSALATTLKEAVSFELKAFSPPDAAAFGSKLLADKGETIGREDVVDLQCIYEELDNLPGAIERVMVHCSLREESDHPRRVLEKLRAGIPLNEIAYKDTAMEMINACAAGGVNMQLSMLFIAPFSHRILNSQANDDLLDYLSWPVRYEGFVSQVDASDPAVEATRRIIGEHGRTAEFAGIMTNDSEGVSFTRQYILLENLLDAIQTFTSLGYIIPETRGSSTGIWIHPMLTAFLRHHLRVKIPQMKPRIERSFVHFMLNKKFSPESWIHGMDSIPEPGQVSVREFLDVRIQREPWNYVNAVILGADLINEEQGGGVIITLVDYLDALRHILIALGGTDAEKWFDVVIPVGERVVNKYFLGPRQEAFTQTYSDKELEAVLSILKDLSSREIRVKRQAGHRLASKYLRQAVDIGERHRLVGKSKDLLDRCKDSLRWLTGGDDRPEAPGPAEAGLPADYIDLQDLASSSRYATTGNEAVLKDFRAYLSVLQAALRSGRVLTSGWERQLLECLDIDRNDDEFAEIALAYGRYIDHENNAQLSELCFQIERQIARQSYAEAKRLALDGLERSLDSGNKYGEFDFRRYLMEISECASSEGLGGTAAAQLGVLRALAHTIGIGTAEWCVCWRHIVRAERAVAGKYMAAARKSYLLALQEAYSACEDTKTHFVKVADELAAKEILSEATLRFLELCRQQTLLTGSSYDPKAFLFLLRSLFKTEPSSEFFLGSTIFQYDAGALQDLEALSGLSETALLGPLIRAYLVLLDASVADHTTGKGEPPDLGEIARRQQHSLFCTAGDGDATEATTSRTAATFSVTDQRSSSWMDSQIREAASYADCVKRTIPPWGRFASVRYAITAGDDELIPVIVGPDSSDDEVEPDSSDDVEPDSSGDEVQPERRRGRRLKSRKTAAEVRAKLEKLRIKAEK